MLLPLVAWGSVAICSLALRERGRVRVMRERAEAKKIGLVMNRRILAQYKICQSKSF